MFHITLGKNSKYLSGVVFSLHKIRQLFEMDKVPAIIIYITTTLTSKQYCFLSIENGGLVKTRIKSLVEVMVNCLYRIADIIYT